MNYKTAVDEYVTVITEETLVVRLEQAGIVDSDGYLHSRRRGLQEKYNYTPQKVVKYKPTYWLREYNCGGLSLGPLGLPPSILFQVVPKTKIRRK